MAISAPERIESAHHILERRGTVPAGLLAPDIYDSWMRCVALGLNTQRPPPVHMVSPGELRQEQQRHSLVRGLALAEMHTLRGRFRSDLLFRLNTLELTLPALRNRADFKSVARHLLALIDAKRQLSDGAVARLASLDWPGNIRELRNVLSRLTLTEGDDLIDEDAVEAIAVAPCEHKPAGTLHDLQRARIRATLAETGNNVSETSRRLGVSRNTVYRALGLGKSEAAGRVPS